MDLVIGTRLGPYEVVAPLGAGGMGEVWRARDTRLDRSVAIKVLPAQFAENAQLRLRFEREAKTISQLNHPHICTLYDVGEGYLVMELLEGESLAGRLSKGPLPLSEVVKYGAQIADALDRAHRAGVVHRDLKPGNIMLTRSGAKLLDFGLAKAGAIEFSGEGATVQKSLTQEGTILGTVQYMAPEQLEAAEADARTDIFALGAVLYEMATGRRAFEGKTKTSLIAAIVSSDPPPISQLQPMTPPALEHVVRKCLSKEPDDRWQSAHDIAEELRWISEAGSRAGVAAIVHTQRQRWRSIAIAALAILIAPAIWFVARRTAPRPAQELFQFIVPVPEGIAGRMSLAPDGRSIAFTTTTLSGERRALWMQHFGEDVPRRLMELSPPIMAAPFLFWSSDSSKIYFDSEGKLKTILAEGGPARTICDVTEMVGGTVNAEGLILFAQRGSIYRVSDRGGVPTIVLKASPNTAYFLPRFLPDGDHFLVSVFPSGTFLNTTGWAGVASLHSSSVKRLFDIVNSDAEYAEPGYVVARSDDKLVAYPF